MQHNVLRAGVYVYHARISGRLRKGMNSDPGDSYFAASNGSVPNTVELYEPRTADEDQNQKTRSNQIFFHLHLVRRHQNAISNYPVCIN